MKKMLFVLLVCFTTVAFAQPAYVYHEKGQKLLNEKKYVEAIAQFDLAIKADATYFEAYLDRGRANWELGKTDLAMADFNKTVQLNPKYAPGFFYRAKLNAQLGNNTQAIADYSDAIKCNPDYAESYANRGVLYVKTNQQTLALADFNKAISLDGKNAEIFYQRGLLYRDMNKPTEALADFAKVVALDATMGKAFFEEGKIHASQNKNDLAVAEYSKAITLGVTGEEIYKRRAQANMALGKTEEALKDYSYLIEQLRTQDVEIIRGRGDLYAKQKNYAYAIRDYNKALGFKRDDVPTLLARADANYQQGKPKYGAAEIDYKKVLTLDPNNVTAARGLAKIYFEQEKWQLAVDQLTVAIKNNPTGADYDLRGKCYFKLNNKKSACEDFSKAEQLGDKDAPKDKLNAGCK